MDRITNNSSPITSNNNEADTCQSPSTTNEAVASCPDGTLAYDNEVCAATGLKGPPTASQRYATALAQNTGAVQSSAVAPDSIELPAAEKATLNQMINDARDAALQAVHAALDAAKPAVGHKLEYCVELPNGCKAKFSVEGALEDKEGSKPEWVARVSGGIEATFGVAIAEAEFSYSRSESGRETLTFEACVFAGIDQNAVTAGELQLQAGLCSRYSDSTGSPALFQLDAVAKTEATVNLGAFFKWQVEAEVRTPISQETLPYDVIR